MVSASLDTEWVRVLDGASGEGVATKRSFKAGEVVISERPLVITPENSNLSRVRAYAQLTGEERGAIQSKFFGEAPASSCDATAACRENGALPGNSPADVLAQLLAEGLDLALDEVISVILVWNLNAYDKALSPLIAKINHSCAANVFIHVDVAKRLVTATACRPLALGETLGSWYFQDTGLWWMGADVRALAFERVRGFACACTRCSGWDNCRGFACASCGGTCRPEGSIGSPNWRCSGCSSISLTNDQLKNEGEFAAQLLTNLKPPPGSSPPEALELMGFEACARETLGGNHWISAGWLLVLHFRTRGPGGALDAFSAACGVRFLGTLMQWGLPTPPATIVRTPITMSIDCANYFGPQRLVGAFDRRCMAARILADFLLPIFDASGSEIAAVAKTGERVDALRQWLDRLRSCCGACEQPLLGEGSACGRCKCVRYCSRDCQKSDWKTRHKEGCLEASESLCGKVACQLLLSNAAMDTKSKA